VEVKPLPFYRTARSYIEDREACPRLRLLGVDLDGHGYQMRGTTVPLLGGTSGHDGFAHLLLTGRLDDEVGPDGEVRPGAVSVAQAAFLQDFEERGLRFLDEEDHGRIKREQLWLIEIILRGWAMVRLPLILRDYEPFVPPETSFDWQLAPDVVEPLRMDVILRNRHTGALVILDFKFTGYTDELWFSMHEYSRQTILYIQGLIEKLADWGMEDVDVEGMMYEGIARGRFKKDTAKTSPFYGKRIQQTPWAYAYAGLVDGVLEFSSKYTNRKGWSKVFVGDHVSVDMWLEHLKADGSLNRLFASMAPTNPAPQLRISIRNQIARAESRWLRDVQKFEQLRMHLGDDHPLTLDHLDTFAEQRTKRCRQFGDDNRCPFMGPCLETEMGWARMKEDEAFEPRVPHHPTPDYELEREAA
jgi:hypothetical protein